MLCTSQYFIPPYFEDFSCPLALATVQQPDTKHPLSKSTATSHCLVILASWASMFEYGFVSRSRDSFAKKREKKTPFSSGWTTD